MQHLIEAMYSEYNIYEIQNIRTNASHRLSLELNEKIDLKMPKQYILKYYETYLEMPNLT